MDISIDELEAKSSDEEEFSRSSEQRTKIDQHFSDGTDEENQNTSLFINLCKTTAELAAIVVNCNGSPRTQSTLTKHLNESCRAARSTQSASNLTSEQLEELTINFTPFIYHSFHQPFPIALVSRLPNGIPGHTDKLNPQDAAWIYAFRYAQKSIFIQTPMFNASPAIDNVLAACRRGIKVTLWLSLGYDHLKQGFGTFQGGTNEHVVKKIYRGFKDGGDRAEKNLEIFWYVAKGTLFCSISFAQVFKN